MLIDQPLARLVAVASSFVGLFAIGYLKGVLVEGKPLRSAIELFVIGGLATALGLVVGRVLKV